ncbi:MAG: polymerase subunit beta [Thermacetogenium sp.]|nr:polymerase subunit beta [Thermacetogenium sp.]
MRFVVDQSVIAPAVAAAARITPSRPTIASLEGVLLKAADNKIVVKATDMILSIEIHLDAGFKIEEEGEILVSAGFLSNYLRKLSGNLLFFTTENALQIVSDQAVSNVAVYPQNDLFNTSCATGNSLTLKSTEWKDIFQKSLLPSFDGIFFELKEDILTVVGTDNYRITIVEVFYPGCGTENFYVTKEQIEKLLPLLSGEEEIEMKWNDDLITFASQWFILTGRRCTKMMPDYYKVIPTSKIAELKVHRTTAAKAFERSSLFATGAKPSAVQLKRNGTGTLDIAITSEVGSLEESLPVLEGTGEFEAKYNPAFIYDALKTADTEDVVLGVSERSVLLIKSGNYSAILAPVVTQ